MGEKYEYLKKVLDDSHYTVALCGSGILAETGCRTFQNQDYAYEIEQKYGRSPEDIFASAYYMTRPDSFFEFYRAEVLEKDWKPSESCYALKKLEDAGKIQCILSDNIFDLEKRAGCRQCAQFAGEHLSEPLSEMRTGISDGIYPGFKRHRDAGTVIMWYVPV